MEGLSSWLKRIEESALFVFVAVTLSLIFVNVVLRYGFNHTLTWGEELARFLFIATTYLGASAGVRKKGHIVVDLLAVIFPQAGSFLARLAHGLACGFALLILFSSLKYALFLISVGQISTGLGVPMWIPYLGVIGGSLMMAFRFGEAFYLTFKVREA